VQETFGFAVLCPISISVTSDNISTICLTIREVDTLKRKMKSLSCIRNGFRSCDELVQAINILWFYIGDFA